MRFCKKTGVQPWHSRECTPLFLSSGIVDSGKCVCIVSEQKRDTPYTCKRNHCVNNTRKHIIRAGNTAFSADKGYQIKAENTNTTPVERTDNRQKQCNSIKHYLFTLSFLRCHYHDVLFCRFYAPTIHFFLNTQTGIFSYP